MAIRWEDVRERFRAELQRAAWGSPVRDEWVRRYKGRIAADRFTVYLDAWEQCRCDFGRYMTELPLERNDLVGQAGERVLADWLLRTGTSGWSLGEALRHVYRVPAKGAVRQGFRWAAVFHTGLGQEGERFHRRLSWALVAGNRGVVEAMLAQGCGHGPLPVDRESGRGVGAYTVDGPRCRGDRRVRRRQARCGRPLFLKTREGWLFCHPASREASW